MSIIQPDRLERWFLERFRLRASCRAAWEAYRVVNEDMNVTIKNLRNENNHLRHCLSFGQLRQLKKDGKIE